MGRNGVARLDACLLFLNVKPAAILVYGSGSPFDCRRCTARDGHDSAPQETQCAAGFPDLSTHPCGKAGYNALDRETLPTDRQAYFP